MIRLSVRDEAVLDHFLAPTPCAIYGLHNGNNFLVVHHLTKLILTLVDKQATLH